MYNLEQITAEKEILQRAVLNARAYKPLYVKIKVNYGCNLKCEMCKHWRATREPVLRPQLPDLVEHATQPGMRVTLTTNAR